MPIPTLATTSTRAMLLAAEARGCDTAALLAAVGLTRATIEDVDARIPAPAALTLWSELRRCTGAELQLSAAAILPWGAYRVIDYIVGASATVGDGVRRFADYFCIIADGRRMSIGGAHGEHWLEMTLADGSPTPGLFVDYAFAAWVLRVRMKIKSSIRVLRVELRHPAPHDVTPYAECFRAPVHFDAPHDRLVFDDDEWNSSMDTPDEALATVLEEHARMLAAQRTGERDDDEDFVRDVRRAITASLPEDVSASTVASRLCVSVRTLQRKLDQAGTTFRDVTDAARRDLAQGYLVDPSVSIAEVAYLLGFSDQPSFNRAFRRWTGAAPGVWRSQASGRAPFRAVTA